MGTTPHPLAAPTASIDQAIAQGRTLHAAGASMEALELTREALKYDSNHVGLLINLGIFAASVGDRPTAEGAYRRALAVRPDLAEAWNNLGNLLASSRSYDDAEAAYRKAIEIRPGYGRAHLNLGLLFVDLGRHEDAATAFQAAIDLQPDSPDAHGNLAAVMLKLGRFTEAVSACREALAIKPGHVSAISNLCLALVELDSLEEAKSVYELAKESGIESASLDFSLGNLYWRHGKFADAEARFRSTLAIDPGYPLAWNNLGGVLLEARRPIEAEAAFRRELDRDRGTPEARWNLAMLLLGQGRYEEGWREYEVRLGEVAGGGLSEVKLLEPARPDAPYRLPRLWLGEALEGKKIVAWSEGGFGDEIQFARFIPMLRQRGARHVTLVCRSELKPLFEAGQLADQVISKDTWQDSMADKYDVWCPFLSLPHRLAITLETLPARIPYLSAVPGRIEKWRLRLAGEGLRIGLVWRGNPNHDFDGSRSLPSLSMLAPLWSVPGLRFFSLQRGLGEDEARTPLPGQPLIHLGSELGDFADTAAIVSQLDLLITVDTSSAHLSAACGKSTWILVPGHRPDWRWLTDRDDSPWYPGVVRLFRQQPGTDWQLVIENLHQALERFRHDHT
ncbi:MAG: tetratricopeptide repeat protein [Rhodocyclales bacterium]|nr:tetratricopeptide repeat protein [Rhodocyclales bacterium]